MKTVVCFLEGTSEFKMLSVYSSISVIGLQDFFDSTFTSNVKLRRTQIVFCYS
jgi:hypothetical protein